jgi:hypothetical protein
MPKARLCTLSIFLLLIALSGCSRTATDDDAIRAAINAHVAAQGNLNASAFDTEVQKVTIQGDQAQADVAFHVKGGPGVMQLSYTLKKAGGNWAVLQSNPVGSNFEHPALDGTGAPPGAATHGTSSDIFDAIHEQLRTQPSGLRRPQALGDSK